MLKKELFFWICLFGVWLLILKDFIIFDKGIKGVSISLFVKLYSWVDYVFKFFKVVEDKVKIGLLIIGYILEILEYIFEMMCLEVDNV